MNDRVLSTVLTCIESVGWLPDDVDIASSLYLQQFDGQSRLFYPGKTLNELWKQSAYECPAGLRQHLESFDPAACLSFGIPGLDEHASADWIGVRLIWWPRGVPELRRVGIVSSRLGRQLDQRQQWFDALRMTVQRMDPLNETLVCVPGTTTYPFARRTAELFGVQQLDLQIAQDNTVIGDWLNDCLTAGASLHHASVSPEVACPSDTDVARAPIRDRLFFAISDRLHVLHLRRSGTVDRLLRARLTSQTWTSGNVRVCVGEQLVSRQQSSELQAQGAIPWILLDRIDEPTANSNASSRQETPMTPLPHHDPWIWLTHCTRRCDRPWPEQSEDEFLDDLILDRRGKDHSAFAALWRIVTDRRLIASSRFVRGTTGVVSLVEKLR